MAELRVLLLTDRLVPGGVSTYVVSLANSLVAAGHAVHLAVDEAGAAAEGLAAQVVLHVGPARGRTAWLRRLVRQVGPDVVHVHQRRPALRALLAAGAVPVVEHVHSVFPDRGLLSHRNRRLVAVGSQVGAHLQGLGRPAENINIVRNGVPDAGPPVPLPPAPHLLAVGRLVPEKDPRYFAALVTSLRGRGVHLPAVWLGDGDEEERSFLEAHGVRVAGWSDDVRSWLDGAAALVVSSRQEGLPLVALEALCAGRAVLARRAGSTADAVVHGWNGLEWALDTPPEDAAALVAPLLADREALAAAGARSRRLYDSSFRWERVVDDVVAVYRRELEPAA